MNGNWLIATKAAEEEDFEERNHTVDNEKVDDDPRFVLVVTEEIVEWNLFVWNDDSPVHECYQGIDDSCAVVEEAEEESIQGARLDASWGQELLYCLRG